MSVPPTSMTMLKIDMSSCAIAKTGTTEPQKKARPAVDSVVVFRLRMKMV